MGGHGRGVSCAPPASRCAAHDVEALDQLTPQELRIAQAVADGQTTKDIAARLFLSPRTVEYHLYKIFPKLGISSRTELARLVASDPGLVGPG